MDGSDRDDTAVTAATASQVVCDVYDQATGRNETRRFDLATGRPRAPA